MKQKTKRKGYGIKKKMKTKKKTNKIMKTKRK